MLAARYIASNGDPAQVANRPWDDSVKSLVRYPDVLKWMDQNLDWTTALGKAFLDQLADVMNSIQGLRMEAIAAGNLADSPQQQVVQEETVIRIVPSEPDVIYVPQYDPDVVYVQPYSQNFGPVLTFGADSPRSWLNYDCDWRRRSIYVGQWRPDGTMVEIGIMGTTTGMDVGSRSGTGIAASKRQPIDQTSTATPRQWATEVKQPAPSERNFSAAASNAQFEIIVIHRRQRTTWRAVYAQPTPAPTRARSAFPNPHVPISPTREMKNRRDSALRWINFCRILRRPTYRPTSRPEHGAEPCPRQPQLPMFRRAGRGDTEWRSRVNARNLNKQDNMAL